MFARCSGSTAIDNPNHQRSDLGVSSLSSCEVSKAACISVASRWSHSSQVGAPRAVHGRHASAPDVAGRLAFVLGVESSAPAPDALTWSTMACLVGLSDMLIGTSVE